MLVSMKQTVLDRAEDRRPAPRRRGRRAGIAIGVIALLGLGATSGAVALGMIPQPFAEPAPTSTPSPTAPAVPSTPAAAPVQEVPVPVPTPTPTPTPTRGAFVLDDPSTWTISANEVGPVALGGQFDDEVDDLGSGSVRPPVDDACPAPGQGVWTWDDGTKIEVLSDLGNVVRMVRVIGADPTADLPDPSRPGPRTAGGFGRGATLTQLRSEYHDLRPANPAASGQWSVWQASSASGTITFETGIDGETVVGIRIGDESQLPQTVCD
ncbi:hypothetical protein DEJ16_13955 [Curtobacterium sp. MCJR17_055]|nr:hypothetical protein DEI87_12415 [Curtobacterium sp. MCBD17_029]PYY53239.1 hypothetical protein DEJ16_13955 [Curtobacterium sp. MCJR17_055]PYY56394.1 hypothetical protein DEJ26_13195 [Curtobacterium sp. MCPF17_015]